MVKSHTHGMEHHHFTDIAHNHAYSNYVFSFNPPSGELYAQSSLTGYTVGGGTYYTEGATGERYRYSGGAVSDQQSTPRTQTDSNNSAAVETRPTNFTVKIWKRTA